MGRKRKAWLWNATAKDRSLLGRRFENGKQYPGFYARYSEKRGDRNINRSMQFESLQNAKKWVDRYNAKMELGQIGELIPTSIDEACEEYGRGGSGWANETARQYGISLGMFRRSVGHRDVHSVTPQDIDRFVAERSQRSKATAAKHVRAVHAFFEWAIARHYCAANPVKAATSLPKRNIARQRPAIDNDVLSRLIGVLTGPQKLAAAIAMTMGLDRGTLERLTPEQVHTDDWSIHFIRQKTGEKNVVPIPSALVSAVRERLRRTPAGKPLLPGLSHQKKEKDWWSKAREQIGMPGLLFRDLRAVASTRYQKSGATAREAQELLGHKSVLTTLENYDVPDSRQRELMRQLPVPGFPLSPAPKRARRARAAHRVSARRPARRASKSA